MKDLILTKDTAISVGLAIVLAGAVWWASDITTRMKGVEEKVAPIEQMGRDISAIKESLKNRTAAMK